MNTQTVSDRKAGVSPVIRQSEATMKPPMSTAHVPQWKFVGVNWAHQCDEYVCRECKKRSRVALLDGEMPALASH